MSKGRFVLPVLMSLVFFAPRAQAESVLKLDQVYSLVLTQNPQVQGYRARVMAAEGNRIQQALMPNPEAVFEIENFGGDDPRSGFDNSEYTLGVEQQIEVVGKRSKREHVASLEKQYVSQEALAGVQATLAQTKMAYMRMAIAQERLLLAEKRMKLADKTHKTVKSRIRAAKAADIQHTKADIEVSAAEVEKRKAEKEFSLARTALANLMGLATLAQVIEVDLTTLPEMPSRESVVRSIEDTPMSVMNQLSVMRQGAALELARANGVPDPTFGVGMRHFAEDDGTAFLASISIPIMLFDRNQGAVAEAKANLKAAQSEQEAERLRLTKQAMALWQTLMSSKEEVLAYQDNLLPSATRAYAQAEDGFIRGAFSFLDLLDAQRTLFDMQEARLDALATLHETQAQVDMLTGVYTQIAATAFNLDTNEKE